MRKILCFQLAMLVVVGILATIVGKSVVAFASAILGGLCYLVPTATMALVVRLIQKRKDNVFEAQMSFVVGESVKILLAVALMTLCILFYSKLIWIWFFIGFVCVSKFIYLVIWKFGHYGSRNRK